MHIAPDVLILLTLGIFVIAALYSSVGHAGASGYIAVMTLLSMAPEWIKPTALTLNILVASIGTWQFWRAGHFSWSLFWPFAVLAVPFAFIGGYVDLPAAIFKTLLGGVLLFSAARLLMNTPTDQATRPPSRLAAVLSGGGIGLLSGLTGTGGGIFLTPLLLLMRWATAKPAAAVSALFILLNSAAGLLGNLASTQEFPAFALVLAAAAGIGGSIGSYFGSQRFAPQRIKRLLAVVLTIAGGKLLLG